jgi:hypothetical protein
VGGTGRTQFRQAQAKSKTLSKNYGNVIVKLSIIGIVNKRNVFYSKTENGSFLGLDTSGRREDKRKMYRRINMLEI